MSNAVSMFPAGHLHDEDLLLWAHQQGGLLEERRFGELDLNNLIEEIRSVGDSGKREIYNRMEVLIAHLLKWRYQPGRRTPSWQTTIRHQRTQIGKIIENSPSLRRYPVAELSDAYVGGRLRAADETGIDFTLFPGHCPFTVDQVLDPVFLPEPPGFDDQT